MDHKIQVPLCDLIRQMQALKPELMAAVERVLASGRYILGPEVKAFEQEVAGYCDVKHAIGVASGTDALLLSLKAAGIGPGDQVITTPFTFFATAGAIVNAGAQPVFVDIEPDTYNIDPVQLAEVVHDLAKGEDAARRWLYRVDRNPQSAIRNPKCILPVHLYGQMADMDAIMDLGRRHGLIVIEDAAQAIGAQYKGRKAGTLGHLGCFSFFPSKNLGGYGDGGMVVTDDGELAERVRTLRVHGSQTKYYHRMVGHNSRLDALQAALLRVKLPHLDTWSAQRQQAAARYRELLGDIKEIELPAIRSDRSHIYHQFTIRVEDGSRDALRAHMNQAGIGTAVYYPLPLHLQECFDNLGYRRGHFPEAERASQQVLSLPMFPELTASECEDIAMVIASFFGVTS